MKLLLQTAAVAVLLLSSDVDAKRKKRKRKIVVKKDTRQETASWDQEKYAQHWQTLGACGVPMVAANDDIVTGIPKAAFEALEELTSPDNYLEDVTDERSLHSQPGKRRGRTSGAKKQGVDENGRVYEIRPNQETAASAASWFTDRLKGMGGKRNTIVAKNEEASRQAKKLAEMPADSDWKWGFSNKYKKNMIQNNAVRPQKAADFINSASSMMPRVVGGRDSTPDTWPWQVHLTICGKWYGYIECNVCGASILNPVWLLTAAHCVPKSPSGYTIYGTNNIASNDALRAALYNWKIHENWNPNNFDNDVALVQPKKVIEISKSASPICLPTPDTCWDQHTACVVTGWGLTGEKNTIFPDHLQEVAVRLIDQDVCKTKFKNYHILTENMLCAGYSEGQRDACAGDSGGPLVCKLPGMNGWVLHGTVSWGYGCARQNAPGVYADVKKMIPWIHAATGLKPDENLAISKKAFSVDHINSNTGCFKASAASEAAWYSRDITEIIAVWKNKVSNSMTLWQNQVNKTWVSAGGNPGNPVQPVDQSKPDEATEEVSDFNPLVCNPITQQVNINGKKYSGKSGSKTLSTNLSTDEITQKFGVSSGEAVSAVQEGSISTAFYPRPHPPVAQCEYVVQNTDLGRKVALTMKAVNLDCRSKTYVYIINGDTKKTSKLCRMKKPIKYTSSVGFVISFVSNQGSNSKFKGFSLDYNYLSATHVCSSPGYNMMKEGQKTKLATENWPKNYSPDSQCRWSISFPKKENMYGLISLEFTRGVKTERGVACGPENDNFIIFEAADCSDATLMKAQIWGSLCGWSPARQTHEFNSDVGICVVFIADGDKKRSKGAEFLASFEYREARDQQAYNKPRSGGYGYGYAHAYGYLG